MTNHEVTECYKKINHETTCSLCNTMGHSDKYCKKAKVHFVELEDDEDQSEN